MSPVSSPHNILEEGLLSIEFISEDSRLNTSVITGKWISEFASQIGTGATGASARLRWCVKVVNDEL